MLHIEERKEIDDCIKRIAGDNVNYFIYIPNIDVWTDWDLENELKKTKKEGRE